MFVRDFDGKHCWRFVDGGIANFINNITNLMDWQTIVAKIAALCVGLRQNFLGGSHVCIMLILLDFYFFILSMGYDTCHFLPKGP